MSHRTAEFITFRFGPGLPACQNVYWLFTESINKIGRFNQADNFAVSVLRGIESVAALTGVFRMGKRMVILLCVITMISLLYASTVLADEVSFDSKKQTVTVTCTHLEPGAPYAFIATTGTNISKLESSEIIYLNQFTAGENGSLSVLIMAESFRGTGIVSFYMGGKLNGAEAPHLIGKFENISSLSLPAMLTEIQPEAFAEGTFQAVYLGSNVKGIGKNAFKDCRQLTYIFIPATTEEIAEDAFDGCGKLTIGCVKDSPAYRYALEHGFEVDEISASAE